MFLLDDILLLPFKGLIFIFKELQKHVDTESTDTSMIQQELYELQLLFEMDEITKEEFERSEAEILTRLQAIRDKEEIDE